MPVIANTTIISNFAAVGHLDLLRQSWPDLNISEQVFTEIQAGFAQGFRYYANIEQLIYPLTETGWLQLTSLQTSDEFRLYVQLLNNLHHGEAISDKLRISSVCQGQFSMNSGNFRKVFCVLATS